MVLGGGFGALGRTTARSWNYSRIPIETQCRVALSPLIPWRNGLSKGRTLFFNSRSAAVKKKGHSISAWPFEKLICSGKRNSTPATSTLTRWKRNYLPIIDPPVPVLLPPVPLVVPIMPPPETVPPIIPLNEDDMLRKGWPVWMLFRLEVIVVIRSVID